MREKKWIVVIVAAVVSCAVIILFNSEFTSIDSLDFREEIAAGIAEETAEESTQVPGKKIAILGLTYWNWKDVDATLKSFENLEFNDEISGVDVYLLENPSPHSDEMALVAKAHKGIVKKHYLAPENVEGYVWLLFVNMMPSIYEEYDYIAVSEMDVYLSPPSLLEAYHLLQKVPEAFLCSIDLDLANLKGLEHLGGNSWVPVPADRGEFLEGPTGFQFLLFPSSNLKAFFTAVNRKELSGPIALGARDYSGVSDSNLIRYVGSVGKRWIRTKQGKLVHLGWEHYKDPNDEYWVARNQRQAQGKFRIVYNTTDMKLSELF